MRGTVFLFAATLLLAASLIGAGEAELNHRWRGASAIVKIDSRSGCGDRYTNNVVRGRSVSSKGEFRFAAGELARVEKIHVHRKEIEVLLDLDEPLLIPLHEGPFTLYDELRCKVELQIRFPSDLNPKDGGALEALIAELLDRHDDAESARRSGAWNKRVRDPYPENYEATRAEYETWKAEQLTAETAAKIDNSIDEAVRLLDRLDDEPEFLAGFGAGVDNARDRSWSNDCDRLLSITEYSFIERPTSDGSGDWKEGFEQGQKLVFHLETAKRLRLCLGTSLF